jgi:hypothetical protein
MNEARQFLLDDITALMNHDKAPDWLYKVNDDGLYALWKDLVNLSTTEALE